MANKRPCYTFLNTGSCPRDPCPFSHERKPCHFFALGRCRSGDSCKFSHDLTAGAVASDSGSHSRHDSAVPPPPALSQKERNTQTEVREWRRDIPHDPLNANKLYVRLAQFFQQALKLAGQEAGVTQEIITSLASQGGLVRISELVNQPFNKWSDAVLENVFSTQVIPFFQLLCHHNVDRSVFLESHVVGIYSYLFGATGQRAVALLTASVRYLAAVQDQSKDAMESILTVFAKIMNINATAQINDQLEALFDTLAALIEPEAESVDSQPVSRLALRHLRSIRQRFQRGQLIPTPAEIISTTENTPMFVVARDMPGQLSDDGPRHDNDHVSIADIKIMPTAAEIAASRNEYLSGIDPQEWHVAGVPGLLDRNFRLLREDTVGQLRDAAKYELEKLLNPVTRADDDKRARGTRTYVYRNVLFEEAGFDFNNGLEYVVSFDQPFTLNNKTEKQSTQMWDDSKRLVGDTLVCLVDTAGGAKFFMVSSPPDQRGKPQASNHTFHKKFPRCGDQWRANVVIRPVESHHDLAKEAVALLSPDHRGGYALGMTLVEFPNILVPAFRPTLAALQEMSMKYDLPFADLLIQAPNGTEVVHGDANRVSDGFQFVPPPAYAISRGFQFDLRAVSDPAMSLRVGADGKSIDFDMDKFKQSTRLDPEQAEALISSFCRSFALTQGPPGTGKSFTGVGVIKVLLDNKARGDLGPIILVAYTNHALDQLLEHLLSAGVKQMVRIGSRSESIQLQNLNLKVASKKIAHTKTEKQERWRLNQAIVEAGLEMTVALSELVGGLGSQQSVKDYLQRNNPQHHEQIFSLKDDDGFERIEHYPGTMLQRWLGGLLHTPIHDFTGLPARSVDELQYANLREVSIQERAFLYYYWQRAIRQDIEGRIFRALHSYTDLKRQFDLIRTENDLRALKMANIVGLTTSGLACNLTLLRKLPSKVLVSEEAGEVLEAHLLTAMLPSLEHVMLIGDHQQLRPQVQNYALSSESQEGKQYCLDVSLFERLVKPLTSHTKPLPFSTLERQRRMHPEISQLIRSTLYPRLKDGPNVSQYPEVSGLRRRLFWLNHDHAEDKSDALSTSKTNEWEAEMTTAMVSHIVRQGVYKPSEIAVLTPYLGQLRVLRGKLRAYHEITLSERDVIDLGEVTAVEIENDGANDDEKEKEKADPFSNITRGTLMDAVRLSTIDNFQGEEAKVVVISLVRCNEQLKPGFLRTENRCNVLLSRAMHGMYIIGNATTAATVPMWAKVLEILKPDNFGDALQLCCPRHPEKTMYAKNPEDIFCLAPAGGCQELCARQLPKCGHACPNPCHSDLAHEDVFCQKDCFRPMPGGCIHSCPNRCGEACPQRCEVPIPGYNVKLECGHTLTNPPCYQTQELETFRCPEMVERTMPVCSHSVYLPCHVDPKAANVKCPAKCEKILPCGHTCLKKCATCVKKEEVVIPDDVSDDSDSESDFANHIAITVDHGPCKTKCGRDFTLCKHSCRQDCHDGKECAPCKAKCDVQCAHSKCSKPCNQPCVPCAEETCASQCEHSACNMPCAAPCDWVPCSKRCSKALSCGCQCPTVCGEVCPSLKYCQNCGSEDILTQPADFVEFNNYEDIDLDDDPVVVLNCGHVFTISTLDGLMDMSNYYILDAEGLPLELKTAYASTLTADASNSDPPENSPPSFDPLNPSDKELKVCPSCRGSLRNVARYGRIVRRALLDESTKKFITWSNGEYVQLAQLLFDYQQKLSETSADVKVHHRDVSLIGERDEQILNLRMSEGTSRYGSIFGARRMISEFLGRAQLAEQPFQRVRDMVEAARRKQALEGTELLPFDFDQSMLQTRASLLTFALLLRCDITIISDFLSTRANTPGNPRQRQPEEPLQIDFHANRLDCEKLADEAERTDQPSQQLEAHLYWVHYAALELQFFPFPNGVTLAGDNTATSLRQEAHLHLQAAERLSTTHPRQTHAISSEIEPTRRMLNHNAISYQPVTSAEMRTVIAAMATEFGVAGHWYRCANGHPFTVGECGGPMQTSRCPQCGAPVGGRQHQAAEGVTRAEDLEREFGGLRL